MGVIVFENRKLPPPPHPPPLQLGKGEYTTKAQVYVALLDKNDLKNSV